MENKPRLRSVWCVHVRACVSGGCFIYTTFQPAQDNAAMSLAPPTLFEIQQKFNFIPSSLIFEQHHWQW